MTQPKKRHHDNCASLVLMLSLILIGRCVRIGSSSATIGSSATADVAGSG